jgi:hypothetical protein
MFDDLLWDEPHPASITKIEELRYVAAVFLDAAKKAQRRAYAALLLHTEYVEVIREREEKTKGLAAPTPTVTKAEGLPVSAAPTNPTSAPADDASAGPPVINVRQRKRQSKAKCGQKGTQEPTTTPQQGPPVTEIRS